MWVRLTQQEEEDHLKERAKRIATIEVQVKKRKERSDKGKSRGPRNSAATKRKWVDEAGDESIPESNGDATNKDSAPFPAKKKHSQATKSDVRRKLPLMPKSIEFIKDSDDEQQSSIDVIFDGLQK
ncbi:hypothetical protein H0H81_004320 [Sphagnurus paluster]|uniref:Uncharacterized protein n=1 Tax=Sphagnurus paluster TaxID=117069 RepID=A0A9P7FS95_9AGAR|nr:hypothetical protein H0H81_004320 [Sphagnurus paluster]